MSKIIDQSIQEYEMISPECSGHESNTNEIQMRDDGQCHKLCKMEHEDIKHSKTKENAFQDENHQLQQEDIMWVIPLTTLYMYNVNYMIKNRR